MPQLMPLMWILSGFMIFMVVFVYLNLFFMKSEKLNEIIEFNLLKKNYLLKW